MTDITPEPSTPHGSTSSETAPAPKQGALHKPVTLATLIWAVVIILVLSFLGSLIAGALNKGDAAAVVPVPTVTVTETPAEPDAVAPEEIYPAGSDMRAGAGAPGADTGADGDVYIDTTNANVWVHRNGTWQLAGNIRDSAAKNLSGTDGAAGADGATGETGASGAPGAPGTSVVLGTGAPEPITCAVAGDIYIDTTASQYYSCVDGMWALFDPEHPTTLPG